MGAGEIHKPAKLRAKSGESGENNRVEAGTKQEPNSDQTGNCGPIIAITTAGER
jgi:hypothetical protein